MAIYHIVLLPKQRQELNNLRNKLYTGGYRYSLEPSSSDVHVSVNQASFNDTRFVDILRYETEKIAKKYAPFAVPYKEITEKIYTGDEDVLLKAKYPRGRGWVSLLFDNKRNNIGAIASQSIEVAKRLSIDDMDTYVARIKTVKPAAERTDDVLDYTANHMNICNYATPEKTHEAKCLIEQNTPKEIVFDTIALRNAKGNHVREIPLA